MSAKKTKSDDRAKTDQTKTKDASEEDLTTDLDDVVHDTSDAEPPMHQDETNHADETPGQGLSETETSIEDEQTREIEQDPVDSETDTTAASETENVDEPATSDQMEAAVERVIERRGGFFPALLGGAIAGLFGFALGASDVLSPYLPAGLQRSAEVGSEDLARLEQQFSELEDRVNTLPPPPDVSGLEAQMQTALSEQALAATNVRDSLTTRLDALDARLTELASAPVNAAVSEEAVAAYERELAAAQAALQQQRSDIEDMIAEASRMEAEAESNARAAQAQAAATRLFNALETGDGFGAEVAALQSLGVAVPAALADASEGVASLASLQSEFPDLARSALATAREAEGGAGGVTGFLQRQLGARSVTPREGADADAVLSRAEGALIDGDLAAAVAELSSLPEAAQTAMTAWTDQAMARMAALGAADELAQTLRTN